MQMLIHGLGWPAAETQRPGPPGQGDPPDTAGVLAGPGLRTAEDELKAQLLALQVVSRTLLLVCCAELAGDKPQHIQCHMLVSCMLVLSC